jgi:chromosome segregation ATPase
MKAKLKTIFSVSILALLLTVTPTIVIAQGTDEENQTNTTTTTTGEQTEAAELKARLEKRKAELKTSINAAKQARIKSRCKASQGKLSSISGRIKGLETSRSQVYKNLINRLDNLSDKLAAKGADVATLDEQITQLETLIETFNTDLAAYKQAVADLADMDCVADPTAFQASLDAARTARAKTHESAKAVRSYLTGTIKPTLKDIRAQLEPAEETE